jgi:hypothetical protein
MRPDVIKVFIGYDHASRALRGWIGSYNYKRPHQALKMLTLNQAFKMFTLVA